jgi:Domain of unknown function (DUF4389)
MAAGDYPADFRADYPQRSSRGWAVLTILLIKLIALIPHAVVLVFLGIAQWVVAFIAQFVVAFKGEYPAGMHEFVTGVLRWGTRVVSFALSLTDKYPPFSLKPLEDYPVDVVVRRPSEPSRVYAVFTIVVQILVFIGVGLFTVWAVRNADAIASWNSTDSTQWNYPSSGGSGLLLRQIAALPHYIVLVFLGIAAFFIWVVVQWVILFVARFPAGLYEVMEGYMRWTTRVNAYALGLIDRYPPFTLSPSLVAQAPPAPPAPSWPAAPSPAVSRPVPPPPAAPPATPPPAAAPEPGVSPPPEAPTRPPAPQTPAQPPEPPPPEAPKQP